MFAQPEYPAASTSRDIAIKNKDNVIYCPKYEEEIRSAHPIFDSYNYALLRLAERLSLRNSLRKPKCD